MLLHNENKGSSIRNAYSIYLKESYDNTKLLLESVQAIAVESLWEPQVHWVRYEYASRLHEILLISLSLCPNTACRSTGYLSELSRLVKTVTKEMLW